MNRRTIAIIVVGIAILAILTTVAIVIMQRIHHAAQQIGKATETTADIGDVVTQVREMSRLETAAMHVVNISTITQSYNYVPRSLGNDEITLYSEGDVIAGIDLSRVQQSDVWREPDGTLVMYMPEPQIFITRLDSAKTRVLNRNTGLLRRADPNLESRLRVYSESAIRKEAAGKGILNVARQNGQQKLATFLHTLGFQRVKFLTRDAARAAS